MTAERLVHCAAGPIAGSDDGTTARFLGIPYAAAPVGARRFAPPVRRAPFATPFDAGQWGATPQRGVPYPFTTVPEPSIAGDDVLTLNVFAPASPPAEGAPVLVWIHGGGYLTGSPASPWYDGSALAARGVVFVSISYRLGFEGFGLVDGQANRGVLDWLAALSWVQENIRAFGGDPDRVTVAGQSAGGGAVLTLLSVPDAQPLFARAVAISGIDLSIPAPTAAAVTARLAADLGVEATASGFGSVDALRLQEAALAFSMEGLGDGLPFGPMHGDGVIPVPVRDAQALGGRAKPLLLGSTADEFDSPGFAEFLAAATGEPAPVGPGNDAPAAFPRATDVIFRATCAGVARARSQGVAGTWLYSFDWASPVLRGAAHCIDIPFFLGTTADARVVLGATVPAGLVSAMPDELLAFVNGDDPSWARALGELGDAVRVYGRDGEARTVQGAYDDVLPLIAATAPTE